MTAVPKSPIDLKQLKFGWNVVEVKDDDLTDALNQLRRFSFQDFRVEKLARGKSRILVLK